MADAHPNGSDPNFAHDPRSIAKSIYDEAKTCWVAAISAKGAAAALGILFALQGWTSTAAPWCLASLALLAELAQWRSDILKGRAEQLKRKIEFYDGLGWPLSSADMSDYLARISTKRRKAIEQSVRENYFASTKDKGVARSLENLQESSWWSKHLSATMGTLLAVAIGALVAGALVALAAAIAAAQQVADLQATSKVVCAVLSLAISLGSVKLLSGYFGFARKSEQVEESTKTLMAKAGSVTETDAVKLTHDYQIARAGAPLIPDLLWSIKRDSLNALWDTYRRGR